MQRDVLTIEGLSVEFKQGKRYIPAVTDVSLRLKDGEILGLVGESGCGKSVTASSVAGLLPKNSARLKAGSIRILDQEIVGMPERKLRLIRGRDVSMIFQNPMSSLNPVYTVGYQMKEVLHAHAKDGRGKLSGKEMDSLCLQMLENVGIPAPELRMKEFPHQLSGGMRQRVMIAMALLCKPKLLIADEPTTALDVTTQAQILQILRKLQRESGTSVLLITHDMGVVAETADRVAVMYAGQIVESGTTEQIFTHPLHPYTLGLLRSIPPMGPVEEHLHTIPGVVPTLDEVPAGCRFCNRCGFAGNSCALKQPEVASIDGQMVRCLLYDAAGDAEMAQNRKRFEQEQKIYQSQKAVV